MTALYHGVHRFQVGRDTLAAVRAMTSPSGSFSWVGRHDRGQRLRIHTFRGVPGKHVDVLLADGDAYRDGELFHFVGAQTGDVLREPKNYLLICDIGRKAGRYDGAERWRITFRDLPPQRQDALDPPAGTLHLDEIGEYLHVVAVWRGGMWGQEFPQLRYLVDGRTDRAGILIRQARDWFPFLWQAAPEDVRQLAGAWAACPDVLARQDINDLNRDASQALYRLAVNLGWRKCTLAMRERLGLGADAAQWQRVERIDRLRAEAGLGESSGVGQYTLEASAGLRLAPPRGVCPQCQEIEADCQCQE
jgi:hypothetical protein